MSDPKRKYAGLEHRPRIAAEERIIYCIGMCRLGIRPRWREIAAPTSLSRADLASQSDENGNAKPFRNSFCEAASARPKELGKSSSR